MVFIAITTLVSCRTFDSIKTKHLSLFQLFQAKAFCDGGSVCVSQVFSWFPRIFACFPLCSRIKGGDGRIVLILNYWSTGYFSSCKHYKTVNETWWDENNNNLGFHSWQGRKERFIFGRYLCGASQIHPHDVCVHIQYVCASCPAFFGVVLSPLPLSCDH